MFFSIFEGQQIGFWTRESFCTCASIVEGQWWCDSVAKSVKSQFYNTLRQLQKIIKRREVSPKLVFFPVWKRRNDISSAFFHFGSYPKVQAVEKEEEEGKRCQWITRTNSSGQSCWPLLKIKKSAWHRNQSFGQAKMFRETYFSATL